MFSKRERHCPQGGGIPAVRCQLLSGPACVPLRCVRRCALEPQAPVATLPGPPPEGLADRGLGGLDSTTPTGETCDSGLMGPVCLTLFLRTCATQVIYAS
ncbi:Beta-taxilin [Dissostichus eleginoides]|uniref:Beta-taxilin n=1 Tax=Dissostichus eleginoides TaxID=100907 RepID=A0AAD9BX56_DISEL|nr:Beta-taxilin [Dissostichus eleginoides]